MSRSSRLTRTAVFVGALFLLLLCLGAIIYPLLNRTLFDAGGAAAPMLTWRGLPTPTVSKPGWRSFTAPQAIHDLVRHEGLIWVATDGGVVVWEEQSGNSVKFTSEHGLADNWVTSAAVAPNGRLWFGTLSGGVSRYDGTDWTTFTTENGLPGNEIRDLVITVAGTVWIATDDGLAEYDGRSWTAVSRARTLFQLPGNDVRTLALAPDGRTLYVGTDLGTAVFDGRRWQSLEQVGSQAVNDIRDLAVTPDGRLWAATAAGLTRYNGTSWDIFTSADRLAAEDIRHVAALPDNSVWVAYGEQGLGLTRFSENGGIPNTTALNSSHGLPDDRIQTIVPIADGVFIGSASGLIFRTDSGQIRSFAPPADIPSDAVTGLAATQGTIWVAGPAGVHRFDGGGWQTFTEADGLAANTVSNLTTSPDGALWAAFNQIGAGVSVFQDNQWITFRCPVTGPASPFVRAGVETADGSLWFASEQGVARFDGRSWTNLTTADGLPSDTVQAMALAPSGQIWIGTDQGLAVYDGDTWTLHTTGDMRELAIAPDGTIWFITESEIFRLRPEQQPESMPVPPVSWVYDVLATNDGLWLAAAEGVAFFNGRGWRLDTVTDGLGANKTTAFTQTAGGVIWASSEQESQTGSSARFGAYVQHQNYLSHFDGERWQTIIRPQSSGLAHNLVTDILPTPDGAVWLGTLGGLSRFDGETWQSFATVNGLPADEIYELAYADDTVWTVTSGGIARYQPEASPDQAWRSSDDLPWNFTENVRLSVSPAGALWAGGEREIIRLSGNDRQSVAGEWPTDNAVLRDLTFGPDGRLWVAAYDSDLAEPERNFIGVLDGETWIWHQLEIEEGDRLFALDWIAFAPDGRLWVGNDNGLWRLDLSNENVTRLIPYPQIVRETTGIVFQPNGTALTTNRFSTAVSVLDGASVEAVPIPLPDVSQGTALAQAADGSLWLGTDRGAARRLPDGSWQLFPVSEQELEQTVTTLTAEPNGDLLLGTTVGSILQYRDGVVISENTEPFGGQQTPVSVLLRTQAGVLWRAKFGGSVARLMEGQWERFPANPPEYAAAVSGTAVTTTGTAWLTSEAGLYRIDTDQDPITCRTVDADEILQGAAPVVDEEDNLWLVDERTVWRYTGDEFERAGSLALAVTAVAPDGAVWYATAGSLVRLANGQRQEIETSGLPGPITTLHIAPGGAIWVGTMAGAAFFQGGRWQVVATADGLAHNHVTHIQTGADGSVWLATKGGLSWLRP